MFIEKTRKHKIRRDEQFERYKQEMAERSKLTELSLEPEKSKDYDDDGSLPRTKMQVLTD